MMWWRSGGVALAAVLCGPLAPADAAPPSRANGATIARVIAPSIATSRPGGGRPIARVSDVTSWSRQRQQLLVLGETTRGGRRWVRLLLPRRPNGKAGWVMADRVVLSRTPYWISVRTRSRHVRVYRSGRLVRTFRAVVGAAATPTPHGLAAIYELNAQPNANAFLGPWALSLTIMSNTLRDFGGGPGRVAIHGRAGASLNDPLGTARSHGCIRISNEPVRWLARSVPRGTPVHIAP